MKISHFSILIATGLCAMVFAGLISVSAPWLARESIFEFTARKPKNKNPAEPGAPANGGLATSVDNSEGAGGSPWVS